MDDDLIDTGGLSAERRSLLPGTGFFYPDSLDEDRADERAAAALSGADTAVVADPDADGLACAALLRAAFGRPTDGTAIETLRSRTADGDGDRDEGEDENEDEATWTHGVVDDRDPEDPVAAVVEAVESDDEEEEDERPGVRAGSDVALVPAGPYDIAEGLARVVAHGAADIDVFVCDVCPDEFAAIDVELAAVVEHAGRVRWFDHHQWDPEVAAAVREAGVELVVGESDAECTADVTLRSVEYDFPERLVDLVSVTRDHDLWIKEDPRSDDLADLSYWLDGETYAEVVREYGADLPGVAVDYLERRRTEKRDRIDRAVGRADTHEVDVHGLPADERADGEGDEPDPLTVAVTYGRCSQNEVAERLREQGADAAVVVKPSGSASVRGSATFRRAHEVARQVGGGGHPQAAGCKPDVYDDMLDYAHHWTTRGAVTRRAILAAFESLD
ncbi:phosphohydrolase [Halobacteriales archaeon SW_5_70_135]|nr:MAG: phosphohydrolase [Halobacteriales archaeon SW_5_70_135]